MDSVGAIVFRVVATMIVIVGVWLIMGHRQIGELSPMNFIISITAGAVAGAAIADQRIELGAALVSLVLLGVLQIALEWSAMKNRFIYNKINLQPTVLVENGQILKCNLKKLRITVETLLQLLRDKEVFDISEVEVAIMEPQGTLSVLKKAEYQPLTPKQINVKVAPNQILVPVVIEGELQEQVLKEMGFSAGQIEEFRLHNQKELCKVYVAFMDRNKNLHVINEDVKQTGSFLH